MPESKEYIRKELILGLFENHAFWSYCKPKPDEIPDEIIIEKTLMHLDIEDIKKLFILFPKKKIKDIWSNTLVRLDGQYHSLNILLAYLFFGIKDPENYLNRKINKHLENMLMP